MNLRQQCGKVLFETRDIYQGDQPADSTIYISKDSAVHNEKDQPIAPLVEFSARPEPRTRNQKAYDLAQINQEPEFMRILAELCIEANTEPGLRNPGRQPLLLSDVIYACALKTYMGKPGRPVMASIDRARKSGYITHTVHYNSISKALNEPYLTAVLKRLIELSSSPLRDLESTFIIDSTGFSSGRFFRWFDEKYGTPHKEHDWAKCHLICGRATGIVATVEMSDKYAHDAPYFKLLLDTATKTFGVSDVLADKAYGSRQNAEAAEELGVTPTIAFKSNATGAKGGAWERMHKRYLENSAQYLALYYQRENVEAVISSIKRKFGANLRSKTDVAMRNEVLCKVLCHNIVVLIHAKYELDVDPMAWHKLAA